MEELISKFKNTGVDLYVDSTSKIKYPKESSFGNHVAIDFCVYISTSVKIGDYVHIAPHTSIIGGKESKLIMKDFSGISSGCRILCGSDDFTEGMMNPQVPLEFRSPKVTTITFERFSCVGVNCVVMPGVTLGEGSVIGSGSVVTKDTEPWTIYVGSPAKPIKKRNKEKIIENAKKLGYEF
jgi:galactoside O-acetyltransferase